MSVLKISELRQKSVEELKEERLGLLREQFNLRMQKATGQLSKPHQFKQVRRNIARINTVLGGMVTAANTAVTPTAELTTEKVDGE